MKMTRPCSVFACVQAIGKTQIATAYRPKQSSTTTTKVEAADRDLIPDYTYRPLDSPDHIRVLEVSHTDVNGAAQRMPVLSLKHITLSDPVNYVAISYMWGLLPNAEELLVDGGILRVQANVKPMICDLSDTKNPRYLWIDAVCINQCDDRERSAQVKLIGDIYYRAVHVIAYLRRDSHRSYKTAFRSGKSRGYLSLYSALESVRNAVVKGRPLARGLDYTRLFDNDYFLRRWIIQEICLARSVIIRCDGNELAIGRLYQYFEMTSEDHKHRRTHAAKICNYWRRMANTTSDLETLLTNHEHAICSDRLDKVYALLSLSQSAKEHIPVDYSIQPVRLLISVLHTASVYEGLDPSRTLSFAGFLRQHLEITPQEFEQGMRNSILLDHEPASRPYLARVLVRGTVQDRRVTAAIEDGLHRARSWLPSLRHYPPTRLMLTLIANARTYSTEQAYVFDHNAFFENGDVGRSTVTDANSLWAFSFKTCHSTNTPSHERGITLAGMSSGMVDVNDEVWQFPRTPVALVVRHTEAGYDLVARALVFNRSAWVDESYERTTTSSKRSSVPFHERLSWINHDLTSTGTPDVKTLAMAAGDLLGLMRWISMFAG